MKSREFIWANQALPPSICHLFKSHLVHYFFAGAKNAFSNSSLPVTAVHF